jgi:HEAT repeat protein
MSEEAKISKVDLEAALTNIFHSDNQTRRDAIQVIFQKKEETIQILLGKLKADNLEEQNHAMDCFRQLYVQLAWINPQIIETFMQIIHSDADLSLRRKAVHLIGGSLQWQADSKLKNDFLPLVFDEDSIIRADVAWFLGMQQDSESVPYLRLLLDDEKAVSEKAQQALKDIGTADALFAIQEWKNRRDSF